MLKKLTEVFKKSCGRFTSWVQKITLLLNKSMGWIIFGLAVIAILGISIAVNRYFLYTPITITGDNVNIDGVSFAMSSINCIDTFNIWQPLLFRADVINHSACLEELKVWARLSEPNEQLNFRNILLGFASVVGLILAVWRSWVSERQTRTIEQDRKISEERRFDERFANACKSLSQELNETSYPAHLGAITALRDLAVDNTEYTQRCLDILCSCNQWMEGYLVKFSCNEGIPCFANRLLSESNRIAITPNKKDRLITLTQEVRSQQVIIAIAFVLDKISSDDAKKHIIEELDLSGKILCGINLSKYKIPRINLNNAYLNGADISYANLQGAMLTNAHLQRAYIGQANLQGANMINANLQGANLLGTDLQKALLHNANLQEAYLTESDLRGANLTGASLECANIDKALCKGTIFNQAKLHGLNFLKVDLRGAIFICSELQSAAFNESDMESCILLGCNLYDAEIKKNNSKNILFDAVTKVGHIKDRMAREKEVGRLGDGFMETSKPLGLMSRIRYAWDKADQGEMPKGLNALQKYSILEKDAKGHWIIKPSKIEEVADFYRRFLSELAKELSISVSDVIDIISSGHEPLSKDYLKIQRTLKDILTEFKKS